MTHTEVRVPVSWAFLKLTALWPWNVAQLQTLDLGLGLLPTRRPLPSEFDLGLQHQQSVKISDSVLLFTLLLLFFFFCKLPVAKGL